MSSRHGGQQISIPKVSLDLVLPDSYWPLPAWWGCRGKKRWVPEQDTPDWANATHWRVNSRLSENKMYVLSESSFTLPFLDPRHKEQYQKGMPSSLDWFPHGRLFQNSQLVCLCLFILLGMSSPLGVGLHFSPPCRGMACLSPASRPEVTAFSLVDRGETEDLWASIFICYWLTLFKTQMGNGGTNSYRGLESPVFVACIRSPSEVNKPLGLGHNLSAHPRTVKRWHTTVKANKWTDKPIWPDLSF